MYSFLVWSLEGGRGRVADCHRGTSKTGVREETEADVVLGCTPSQSIPIIIVPSVVVPTAGLQCKTHRCQVILSKAVDSFFNQGMLSTVKVIPPACFFFTSWKSSLRETRMDPSEVTPRGVVPPRGFGFCTRGARGEPTGKEPGKLRFLRARALRRLRRRARVLGD